MALAFDSNLIVLDGSANLTEDQTKGPYKVGPQTGEPVHLLVNVPAGGAAMTLDISIQIETATDTYADYIKWPQITTAPGEPFSIPVKLPPKFDGNVKVYFNVGGTDPNFGKVFAGFSLGEIRS